MLMPNGFPRVFDIQAAKDRLDRLAARTQVAPGLADLLADTDWRAFLEAVFSASGFLADAATADPEALVLTREQGFETAVHNTVATSAAGKTDAETMAILRRARRRAMLLTGLADLGAAWPLERVTGALSDFAEQAVRTALACVAPDNAALAVLAVGKLGARELNYSSDIDIIVLHDERRSETAEQVRRVRALVAMLETRTSDGFVCRTDLRLRPDPAAMPLSVSLAAAEAYYGGLGQNWERAALIKARGIAGDQSVIDEFKRLIDSWIWRRSLDFDAIADIQSVLRQITRHKGHAPVTGTGQNIKLGRGGIRNIEFIAQTQQLIFGGRDPALRSPGTCAALAALADSGRIHIQTADELTDSYRFLRSVEHRLQMIADRQTHTVPADPDGLDRIAALMGDTPDVFTDRLTFHLDRVAGHTDDLFVDTPTLAARGNLVFTGPSDD
ncbi:MAG: glutamine-synthetase adenylyltransferase, partial [Pseudomonadota bacterium]|nr:glutamine-synthetase adenylyltransferase [Pseudomonadota bacterium]